MFRLAWGIHRGTLMSRDVGDPFEASTEKQIVTRFQEIKDHFENYMGMHIWFAYMEKPDGTKVKLCEGVPYSR